MAKTYRVLVINPKRDETTIGVFKNELCIYEQTIKHDDIETHTFDDQLNIRKANVLNYLDDAGINLSKLHAVCARGGLLRPIEGGTYEITERMIVDLKSNYYGKHVSNLGGVIAYEIANGLNIPSYIVDPVVVDELNDLAKYSGLSTIPRRSIFHALNQKFAARRFADEINKKYEEINLIVAHLGNGITIGAHQRGKVIDVNNGLHGDGPFSFTRAGSIPSEGLVSLCFSGQYSQDDIINQLINQGGLFSYLKTNDVEQIEQRMNQGDAHAISAFQAMAYQIAKEIGAMATVLSGNLSAIILTGELAKNQTLIKEISSYIHWIADIYIYPGENKLQALNEGTLRVLRNEESPKLY